LPEYVAMSKAEEYRYTKDHPLEVLLEDGMLVAVVCLLLSMWGSSRFPVGWWLVEVLAFLGMWMLAVALNNARRRCKEAYLAHREACEWHREEAERLREVISKLEALLVERDQEPPDME
jgi:hypothetical protein